MEGFNDVWANILNDDLLNAKELNNVYLLEPRSSEIQTFSPPRQKLESPHVLESMVECLAPRSTHHSQIKDITIMLPSVFSNEKHLLLDRRRDIQSPIAHLEGRSRNPFKTDLTSELSIISLKEGAKPSGLASLA